MAYFSRFSTCQRTNPTKSYWHAWFNWIAAGLQRQSRRCPRHLSLPCGAKLSSSDDSLALKLRKLSMSLGFDSRLKTRVLKRNSDVPTLGLMKSMNLAKQCDLCSTNQGHAAAASHATPPTHCPFPSLYSTRNYACPNLRGMSHSGMLGDKQTTRNLLLHMELVEIKAA